MMYEKEIDFIMRNTDPAYISLGPDTAHLAVGGCDPVEIFRRYIDRIKFVHLKDVKKNKALDIDKDKSGAFEVYSNFLELGEGEVDFASIFSIIKGAGYDGYLTAELDQSRSSNRESAFLNMAYLKKMFLK
jgi:inosose dehydratase